MYVSPHPHHGTSFDAYASSPGQLSVDSFGVPPFPQAQLNGAIASNHMAGRPPNPTEQTFVEETALPSDEVIRQDIQLYEEPVKPIYMRPWYQACDADGYLRVTIQPFETPLGLVIDWSHPLPVVGGLMPGSHAETHKEIVPGLVILELNETKLAPGVDPWDVQQLFKQRPLSIVFNPQLLIDEAASGNVNEWMGGPPNELYEVGETYRTITRILMRELESLSSPVIAECTEGAVLEVRAIGSGPSGRRLKVFAAGRTGWVSCMSEAGVVLLASKPALLIARAHHKLAFDTAVSETGSAAEDDEDEVPKRKVSGTMHQKKQASLVKAEKEELKQNMNKKKELEDTPTSSGRAWTSMRSNDAAIVTGDDDSTESECDPEELLAAIGEARVTHMLSGKLSTIRAMPTKALEMQAEYSMDFSIRGRLERLFRIHDIKVAIITKKIRREEDGPYFPAAAAICEDLRFEVFIAALIVVNGLSICLETFYRSGDRPAILDIAEHAFTAIFLVEWSLRVMDDSWFYFCSAMNLFDTFLVWITGVLVMWILGPAGVDATILRRIGCLRMLRLARLCKAIRLMPLFKELWTLVQGIIGCASLLSWSLIVGCVVHYTFAVACIELIAKSDQWENDDRVQHYFGSLARAMFTLFQIMTFDSWTDKVRPIVREDPKSGLIFFLFIGLAGIVLFNLLTAIVVGKAFEASGSDEEAEAQRKLQEDEKMRTELYAMFQDLDEDKGGYISMDEFLDCMDDYDFVRKMKQLDIDLEELPDIFEILDDGDGQIEQEEFIIGMMHLQGLAMSAEILKATTKMTEQNTYFQALTDSFVQGALETFRNVEARIDDLHDCMTDVIQVTADVVLKLDEVGMRRLFHATSEGLKEMPFIEDPSIEEMQATEKKMQKNARKKGSRKSFMLQDAGDPSLPAGSFVPAAIPPRWIHENGRSPAMQNPGRTRLARHPELKAKLEGTKPKKVKAPIIGVRKEMGHAWRSMDLTLNEDGTLFTGDPEEDKEAGPNHLNSLPSDIAPSSEGPKLWQIPAPKKKTKAGAAKEESSADAQHPNAVPTTPGSDPMAMLGLTAGRGGISKVEDAPAR